MITRVIRRLQLDYFTRNRLEDLSSLLAELLQMDYAVISFVEFCRRLAAGSLPPKTAIMRIDVDTDPAFCRRIADTITSHGCGASFYFRLATLDEPLMRRLQEEGFEVSYHFEEIATVAKRHKLRSAAELEEHLPAIRDEFVDNFETIARILGQRPETVSAHGDYVNQLIGVDNKVIIDETVRARTQLLAESYDPAIESHIDDNFIDTPPPDWWLPEHPAAVARRQGDRAHVMRVLIHPKHWHSNPAWNTKHNLERLVSGLRYRYL